MNKFIKNMKPYKLASHTIWEKETKSNILKLDWNESTIEPSQSVKQALFDALNENTIRYYPDVKNEKLLNKIAEYLDLSVEYVQYFGSSDSAHESIVRALLNENDIVLMLAPTYDNFRTTCESQGAKVCYSMLDENFLWSLDKFEHDLNVNKPSLAYICNPNNPTGTVVSRSDIEYLVTKYENIIFVIDEAYYEFTQSSCSSLVSEYNNIIITRTFSKAYSLAGMRIGYIATDVVLLNAINKVRNAKNIPQLSQVAALASLENNSYMKEYVSEVNLTKEWFGKELLNLNMDFRRVSVLAGNFLIVEFKTIEAKLSFIEYLEDNLIFVRNLSHMKEVELCARVTIGTKQQMSYVMAVLKEKYGYTTKQENRTI